MRHPSTATAFDWDDANIDKLAARQISPVDVEWIWLNRPMFRRNKRSGTALWMMVGKDLNGRVLKVGILWHDQERGILRAITGWQDR